MNERTTLFAAGQALLGIFAHMAWWVQYQAAPNRTSVTKERT